METQAPDGSKWRYAYDPLGRRISKVRFVLADKDEEVYRREWVEAEPTDYLWDGDYLVWEARAGERVDWHFEPDSFVPLAKEEGEQLWYVVADHLGTPRELLSEDGQVVWAAEYGTWGGMRRLWQADNDNEDLSKGDLQGYDLDGKPVYAARFQTSGNLALKPLENPDPQFCPIRFQGQWQDEETGLYYNRFRYYDPPNRAVYVTRPDWIGWGS